MAGTKINDYAIGDANIQSVMLTLDKAFNSKFTVSPSTGIIKAGSVIECAGAFYKFDSDETPSGSKSGNYQDNFVRLVPAGDSITAQWTTTAPTWSDSYQGYYGTSTAATYRYIYVETGSGYYPKHLKSKSDYGVLVSIASAGVLNINETMQKFTIGTPGAGDCLRGASISSGNLLFGDSFYKVSQYLVRVTSQLDLNADRVHLLSIGLSGSSLYHSPSFYKNTTSSLNSASFLIPADLFGTAGTLSVHAKLSIEVGSSYECYMSIEIIGLGDNY